MIDFEKQDHVRKKSLMHGCGLIDGVATFIYSEVLICFNRLASGIFSYQCEMEQNQSTSEDKRVGHVTFKH